MNREPRKVDMVGQRFGRLVVTRFSHVNKHRMAEWWCKCDCGKEIVTMRQHLVKGRTKSCGCLHMEQSTTHGHTSRLQYGECSSTYQSWRTMKSRCTYPKDKEYHNYGGRGIKVCDEWLNDFAAFLKDMGLKPPKMTLERIDVNGNYCKANCRWATILEQAQNRRTNHNITINGVTRSVAAWGREWGIEDSVISNRIKRGWPVEKLHIKPSKVRLDLRKDLPDTPPVP